jgi:TPR repeat protein
MKTLKSTFDELNNHLEENHDSIKERIKGTGKNIKEINLITVFDRYNNNYKGICRMTHKDFDDIWWYLDRKLEWHKSGQKIIQNDIDKLQWLEDNSIEKIEDIDIDTEWRRVTTVFDRVISLRESFKGKAKKAEIKEEDLFYPSRCALFPWLSFDQFKVIQDYHKNQLNWNMRKNGFTTVNEFVSFYKEVQNASMTIGREIPNTFEDAIDLIADCEDIEFKKEWRSAQMRVEPNDSILPIQTTTSNLTVDNDQPSNVIDNTKSPNHTTNFCLSPEELNQLGKSYKKGTQYLKKNKSKSFEFYSKCAELGNKDALYEVACSYQFGNGVEKNMQKSFEYYNKVADQGDTVALYEVARSYQFGNGVEKNMQKSFEYYAKAAELGNKDALYEVARSYKFGNGVEKNMQKSLEYYEKSAELGHTAAQFHIGYCYSNGKDVTKSSEKAFTYYNNAAAQGHISALNKLGVLYEKGQGVKKNMKKAFECYKNAIDTGKGLRVSYYNIGRCYQYGLGVSRSYKKAVEYYTTAADQGIEDAQYRLGCSYLDGKGVEKNIKNARVYLSKAAKNGHKDAEAKLRSLSKTSGPSPITSKPAPSTSSDTSGPAPNTHSDSFSTNISSVSSSKHPQIMYGRDVKMEHIPWFQKMTEEEKKKWKKNSELLNLNSGDDMNIERREAMRIIMIYYARYRHIDCARKKDEESSLCHQKCSLHGCDYGEINGEYWFFNIKIGKTLLEAVFKAYRNPRLLTMWMNHQKINLKALIAFNPEKFPGDVEPNSLLDRIKGKNPVPDDIQLQQRQKSSQKDNTKQTPPDDPVTIDKMFEEFPEDALLEI